MQNVERTKALNPFHSLASPVPGRGSPHRASLWLILALSLFAWVPLLTPAYFFNAHDARHSVFFLVEFDQTFRDGFWYPRWSPDFAFGYGYPLFNLYAPLAFYAAEVLHLLGLGFTTAIKTMYVLATIGAGVGMYGFAQRLFGPRAGLLAAVVYMYAPFHLVEIFVRSAYAEFVALAIIPFVFWAFTELVLASSLLRVALAGLSYGLLALTHHTIFFTFSPFLMTYLLTLILIKARVRLKPLMAHSVYTAGAGLLGLALAAVYLIPVIAETRYIKVEQWTSGSYNYLQHFVYFAQFFSPEWGYGYAGVGLADDFSFQLGIVVIALTFFALVRLISRPFPRRSVAVFFFVSTLVIIYLMSPLAEFVWRVVPIATLVQFPWRLLGMAAFTMSVVAGALLAEENNQWPTVNSQYSTDIQIPTSKHPSTIYYPPSSIFYLLCLVVVLASFPYTLPQYTEIPGWAETPLAVVNWDRASIVDRVGMVSFTQEQPQTSPLEQRYLNGQPLEAAAILTGQGTIETLHRGGASSRVKVNATGPVTLQFYTYDYPGWRVTLDGQPLPHRHEPPFGLITVDVPAGEHIVLLRMGSTPPRTMGAIISILALLLVISLYFWPNLPFVSKKCPQY
ncbi:MAG: hypothetical protein KJ077_05815 [Anaerolineae bacterium]|nr:hypothetical protein [Anaerolineae bacterium]